MVLYCYPFVELEVEMHSVHFEQILAALSAVAAADQAALY
jgi:hypothetical protein